MDVEKLLMVIVQTSDVEAITSALNQVGLTVTWISSVSGLVSKPNVTLLIGVPTLAVAQAVEIIRSHCHPHHFQTSAPHSITPIGGATIFMFSVSRYIHVMKEWGTPSQIAPDEIGKMKLLLVIVPKTQAGKLIENLNAWSYRATLIGTTGGFSRQENATLLIGARSERVNSIVNEISQVGATAGWNDPIATIFVLDLADYERM